MGHCGCFGPNSRRDHFCDLDQFLVSFQMQLDDLTLGRNFLRYTRNPIITLCDICIVLASANNINPAEKIVQFDTCNIYCINA